MAMQAKLSAFVITYNRAALLESCLRAVSFVDELIVVDKSSTDNSAEIAARYADRVEIVPWSPTVEETRAFALSLCQNEWVLFLDDDEILSPPTEAYIRSNMAGWDADIFAIPLRHYILGVHDERAYYWPEEHHRLFRKGAIEFIPTVHGGVVFQSDRVVGIPTESGVCIHHLSYQNVASWIERTNRYTSRPDRIQVTGEPGNLIRFAHAQIDYWMQRTDDSSANGYPAAVALLRAIYDMVDKLKAWEMERGVDGAAMFRIAQDAFAPEMGRQGPDAAGRNYDGQRHLAPLDGAAHRVVARQVIPAGKPAEMADVSANLADWRHRETQATLVQLRATEAQLRERIEAARKSNLSLASTRHELDDTIAALAEMRNDLDQTRATLDQTRAMRDHTQAALDGIRVALKETEACLANVKLESERLSGSARMFIRQYWPKLRVHLARRLP